MSQTRKRVGARCAMLLPTLDLRSSVEEAISNEWARTVQDE